jgi:hypothetical protein
MINSIAQHHVNRVIISAQQQLKAILKDKQVFRLTPNLSVLLDVRVSKQNLIKSRPQNILNDDRVVCFRAGPSAAVDEGVLQQPKIS